MTARGFALFKCISFTIAVNSHMHLNCHKLLTGLLQGIFKLNMRCLMAKCMHIHYDTVVVSQCFYSLCPKCAGWKESKK